MVQFGIGRIWGTCTFCLAPAGEKKLDKNGKTYVVCKSCGVRCFVRDDSRTYGNRLLDLLVNRLGPGKLGFLFTWYEPELVLRALESELTPLLDESISRAVESTLDSLSNHDLDAQASLVDLINQMDDLERDRE